ncbi:MAG TPA: carboxylating nicotinate-nucleotide diphosphorylase [Gemmatimonadales bacterium]
MAKRLGAAEVSRALAEDQADTDVTTELLGALATRAASGRFVAEQPCVVAGGPVAAEVFAQIDPAATFRLLVADGERAGPGDVIAEVTGPSRVLLAGERVALNFLQRLCGIATLTRRAVDGVSGTAAKITDTRKTTPGLRALEKYAVRMGGGVNHRFSLGDGVLLKDNHWALLPAGTSLGAVLDGVPAGMPVIVEVETTEQLDAAVAAGVRRLLVDNQTPARVAEWVRRCPNTVEIEASGGITPDTACEYARAGAAYISLGALTHSAPSIAIRFDLQPPR